MFYLGHGWTSSRWRRFNALLPALSASVAAPIFRGTKVPWLGGIRPRVEMTIDVIEEKIARFTKSFDGGTPFKIARVMSWTRSRSVAAHFAAQGDARANNTRGGRGFIHILHGDIGGVDVGNVLAGLKTKGELIPSGVSDELMVAKREKEVLLLRGAVLTPVRRRGRVFEWRWQPTADAHVDG